MSEKICDNKSVGVVLLNEAGEMALLERGQFPVGMAPPAGHIDTHGSSEQAAVDEVSEEVGVVLAIDGLTRTVIDERCVDNVCRRTGGDYHVWTVYEGQSNDAELHPDQRETKGAGWFGRSAVQAFVNRTRAYQAGEVSEEEWVASPGMEPVWVDFLVELGHVE